MGRGKSFNPTKDIPSLEGKVILVTGGNTGLGLQTIKYLASSNPTRIYLAARTASKANSAISSIKSSLPNAEIEDLPLDLTSFSSIAAAAEQFQSKEKRLDILINNAGIMGTPYSLTKEGYEIQFGTNHVGHALFTKLLLPTLLKTAQEPGADVRVVNLASMAHYMAPSSGIVWDQKALENQITWRLYGQSKLANILFTRELALRYPSITSVATHPGVIITDLYNPASQNFFQRICVEMLRFFAPWLPGFYKDTKGGALNQTWAAVAKKDELKNGAFYQPVGKESGGSKRARDQGLQKKLWEWTEAELGKHGY